MTTLDQMRKRRPGNRDRINRIKAEMDREFALFIDEAKLIIIEEGDLSLLEE